MKYVKFIMSNGYCDCDEEEYVEFEENTTEEEIDEYGRELLINFYSYFDDDSFIDDEEDDYDNAITDYQMNCYVDWDYVTKEEWEENKD